MPSHKVSLITFVQRVAYFPHLLSAVLTPSPAEKSPFLHRTNFNAGSRPLVGYRQCIAIDLLILLHVMAEAFLEINNSKLSASRNRVVSIEISRMVRKYQCRANVFQYIRCPLLLKALQWSSRLALSAVWAVPRYSIRSQSVEN